MLRRPIHHPHTAAVAGSTDDPLAVDPRTGAHGCASLAKRRKPVRGVVVHTTGRGLLRRVATVTATLQAAYGID